MSSSCYLYHFSLSLEQVSDILGKLPKVALVDRGFRGIKTIHGIEIRIGHWPIKYATVLIY